MNQPDKLSWWGRVKKRYTNWKKEREFQKKYEKKLKDIKKKDPYTYD